MFEVIISHVESGRVRRAFFATRDEADRYVAREEAWILGSPRRSLRDYRIEVVCRPAPTRPAPALAA